MPNDNYYHIESNISEKWDSDKKIAHDIKWFLLKARDTGGEKLMQETIRAINKGIEQAKTQK